MKHNLVLILFFAFSIAILLLLSKHPQIDPFFINFTQTKKIAPSSKNVEIRYIAAKSSSHQKTSLPSQTTKELETNKKQSVDIFAPIPTRSGSYSEPAASLETNHYSSTTTNPSSTKPSTILPSVSKSIPSNLPPPPPPPPVKGSKPAIIPGDIPSGVQY